jgi:hypothetical protein
MEKADAIKNMSWQIKVDAMTDAQIDLTDKVVKRDKDDSQAIDRALDGFARQANLKIHYHFDGGSKVYPLDKPVALPKTPPKN